MRNKQAVIIAVVSTLLLALLGAVVVGRRPVLFRVRGNVDQQHPFYVLNPLRDRGPEREPEAILKEVSEGRCQTMAMRMIGKPDPLCARDTELRIVSWRLRAREDKTRNDVRLLFDVKRDFGPGGLDWDPYWFDVRRSPDGKWRVVSLERWF